LLLVGLGGAPRGGPLEHLAIAARSGAADAVAVDQPAEGEHARHAELGVIKDDRELIAVALDLAGADRLVLGLLILAIVARVVGIVIGIVVRIAFGLLGILIVALFAVGFIVRGRVFRPLVLAGRPIRPGLLDRHAIAL